MLTAKELPELRIEDYPEIYYDSGSLTNWEKYAGGVRYHAFKIIVDDIEYMYPGTYVIRPMISTIDLRYSGADYHSMVWSYLSCQTCWWTWGDLINQCEKPEHIPFEHQDAYI